MTDNSMKLNELGNDQNKVWLSNLKFPDRNQIKFLFFYQK